MLHKSVVDILNKQINIELHSSNIYLQMALWCATKGLNGAAQFMQQHADEEYQHMQKIFKFLLDNGNTPILGSIEKPVIKISSLKDLFEQALEHEKFVTSSINNCVKTAFEIQDFKTFNFLQWFVDEQVEEEQLFNDVIDKFTIAGNDGLSVFYIDKDLANMHAESNN